jgi:hypothetical protein
MQECGLHAFANNIKIPATLTWRRCPWRRRHGKGVGMAEPDETTVQTHLTCPHCGGALTIQMRGRLRVWDSATGLEPPKPPRCNGSQTSDAGLANIAVGGLTIIANIRAAGLRLFACGLTFCANSLQISSSTHII